MGLLMEFRIRLILLKTLSIVGTAVYGLDPACSAYRLYATRALMHALRGRGRDRDIGFPRSLLYVLRSTKFHHAIPNRCGFVRCIS